MVRYKQRLHKVFLLLQLRFRKVLKWWKYNDSRYGFRWRAANGLLALFILASAGVPILEHIWQNDRYTLSSATQNLVGTTDSSLAKQLTYDTKTATYEFNKDAVSSTSSLPSQLLKSSVGAANKSNTKTYALDVPTDFSKGVTYHDTNSQLGFSLVPQFTALDAKTEQGHVVFPLAAGNQAVYTLKNNGLKEDIVVPQVESDSMSFNYQLELPDTLQAKVIPDSGGAIGIYSADPSLFGNISYGSQKDQAAVEKARETGDKTYLVFGLPSPVIKAANGGSIGNASARFELNGNALSVIAQGLSGIKTSISIDPSVVVTSTSDFQTGGNNDGMIDFSTSGQITRGSLSGGSIGAWTTGNALPSLNEHALTTFYNGYLYVIGGTNRNGGPANYSTVLYSQLNTSTGAFGTWTTSTTSPLPNYAAGGAALAYNGYMYALGGNMGGSVVATVLYASINSDGSLNAWNTTTNMPGINNSFGAAVYNGYIYTLGGATSGSTATYKNNVYYVAVNADGTLGTWNSTTSLSYLRSTPAAVAYNGYLYILGGANTSTFVADVQYAAINPDGTIGAWMTTNSFATGRYGGSTGIYGGYIYEMGGWSGPYKNDVQYAQVNANGSLGTWATSTSFSQVETYGVGGVYNGYAYIGAGYDGSVDYSNMQYSKITPLGTGNTYTTSANTFTNTERGGQSVAYNGFLYVMGGDAGSTPVNTIYAAAIASDGSIGAFTSTGMTAFTTARTYFAAAAFDGYMYVIGGCSSTYTSCTTATNDLATVYSAPINSDGTIGTWAAQTSITTARYGLSAAFYNATLYVMGGLNASTFQNDIQYHTVASGGAISGSWTTSAKTLPASEAYQESIVNGGVLYIAGGCTAGALTCTTTLATTGYAALVNGGDLNAAFTTGPSFTTARGDFGLTISNGTLYIMGGRANTTYYADTQFATITNTGAPSAWATSSSSVLASVRAGIGSASYNGTIYSVGGNVVSAGPTYYNNVQYLTPSNSGTGITGTWTSLSSSPSFTGVQDFGSIAYNGYLYALGGTTTTTSGYLSSVQYAHLNSDGTISAWGTTTSFTTARSEPGTVIYGGRMYVVGGYSGSARLSDIQDATINSDGTLGTWASAGTLSLGTSYSSIAPVVHGGYLYVLHDFAASTTTPYAPINSDGTIGTWVTTTVPSQDSFEAPAVVYGDYVYSLGGYNLGSGVLYNTVQYAHFNTDGTLGTWQFTTSFTNTRYFERAVASNGYMYMSGGMHTFDNTAIYSDAQYARINPNGTLGVWTTITNPPSLRRSHAMIVYNGYMYILGGRSASATLSDVESTPLSSIGLIGRYSKLVNLGGPENISSITYNGGLGAGIAAFSYRYAPSGSTTFTTAPTSAANSIATTSCTSALNSVQYLLVTILLDDSKGGAALGTPANVTDFTVNYIQGHPSTNIRLRLGQTLQSGSLSQLDTCGP